MAWKVRAAGGPRVIPRQSSATSAPGVSSMPRSFRLAACAMRLTHRVERCSDRLLLDRAGQARDVVLDEERVEDDDRDRTKQRAGHQRAPMIDVALDELGDDADRHRLVLR